MSPPKSKIAATAIKVKTTETKEPDEFTGMMLKYNQQCAATWREQTKRWLALSQNPEMEEIWDDLCTVAQPKWSRTFEALSQWIYEKTSQGKKVTSQDRMRIRTTQLNAWRAQPPHSQSYPPMHRQSFNYQEHIMDTDWADFLNSPMEGDPSLDHPTEKDVLGRIQTVDRWIKHLPNVEREEPWLLPLVDLDTVFRMQTEAMPPVDGLDG